LQNTISNFKYNADFGFVVTHFRPEIQARTNALAKAGALVAAVVSIPIFFGLNDPEVG